MVGVHVLNVICSFCTFGFHLYQSKLRILSKASIR